MKEDLAHIDELMDEALPADDPWVEWWQHEYDDTKAYKDKLDSHDATGTSGQGGGGVKPS